MSDCASWADALGCAEEEPGFHFVIWIFSSTIRRGPGKCSLLSRNHLGIC